MTDTTTALDTARALGAEHGKRDAEAWWAEGDGGHPHPLTVAAMRDGVRPETLPTPDLADDEGYVLNFAVKGPITDTVIDAYESAYRSAVETTIRAACQ